jgi:glyoxylase-like metal-dependent hydrolase (beta-lactamase superfamily II)
MVLNRRTFIKAAGAGVAAQYLALAVPPLAQAGAVQAGAAQTGSTVATALGGGLTMLSSAAGSASSSAGSSAGTNALAFVGGGRVLLIDGGLAEQAPALLAAVSGLSAGAPVDTLFNTHWHREQTGANEILGKSGATIIAHENTRLWLTTDVTWPWNGQRFTRLAKVAQPNKTFYQSETLNGIRYGYIPDAAHTDGDLFVFFPEQNVLAVGDVVSTQGWPMVDWTTGGWIGGIVGALQRLQTMTDANTRIVPARGPVLGVADLKAQYEMYGTIYDRLTQMLNKGRGPGEAVAARPTQEFDAQMGNSDEFVRRAFESLWAYVSPDA